VTVEEIADAADVSVRTFFNYFQAKEDAMVGMDPAMLDAVGAAVLERPAVEEPLEVLRNVLAPPGADMSRMVEWGTRRTNLLRQHPSLLARHLAGMVQMERRLTEAIVERTGAGADDLYPAVVVTAAVSTFRLTLSRWDASRPLQDDLARAFEHLRSGLAPPAAGRPALVG
jgi:AcrR family transcriptional regulator